MIIETHSEQETWEVGKKLAAQAKPGQIFALIGDLGGEGVCLVEWANLIEELMPEQTIWLTIEKDLEKGFDYRRITIEEGRRRS